MKMLSIAPGLVIAATATLEAVAVALDLNAIILGVIGLAGTSFMGYVSMKLATIAAQSKENKVVTDKTAETMKDIHIAVNSKETITAKRIDEQNALILELSKMVKTLEEKLRGQELAKIVAESKVPAVILQGPPPPAKV